MDTPSSHNRSDLFVVSTGPIEHGVELRSFVNFHWSTIVWSNREQLVHSLRFGWSIVWRRVRRCRPAWTRHGRWESGWTMRSFQHEFEMHLDRSSAVVRTNLILYRRVSSEHGTFPVPSISDTNTVRYVRVLPFEWYRREEEHRGSERRMILSLLRIVLGPVDRSLR